MGTMVDGGLAVHALVAAVPAESMELAKLPAEHETGAMTHIDYFVRWAVLSPTRTEPHALARLDLRFGGPSIFEARLVFDVAEHASGLWAAARTGLVQLVSASRVRRGHQRVGPPAAMPPGLVLETRRQPLAASLAKLGVPDPFRTAEEPAARREVLPARGPVRTSCGGGPSRWQRRS
jgi:hypothetical protein